jgi:competence protein ComEA
VVEREEAMVVIKGLVSRLSDYVRASPAEVGFIAVAAAAILAGSAYVVVRTAQPPPPVVRKTTTSSALVEEKYVVHVAGLVAAPGVYELKPGSRVKDAIEAAGGALEGADLESLNLAQRIADGEKVLVSKIGMAPALADPPAPGASPGTSGQKVNLNTATQAELEALPGVGPVTAQRMLDFRKQKGRFSSVRDLLEVEGIGPKKYEAIKNLVTT